MIIRVSEVGPEGLKLDVDLDERWMAHELQDVACEEKPGRGTASVSVHLVGSTVNVSGNLRARFYVPCARCLAPARIEMDQAVRYTFARRPPGHRPPEEAVLEADDLEFAYYDGDEIDLAPLLREQLILEVPIAPVCREDCSPRWSAGEPDGGGTDAPVDPRWAALARLKKERERS